MNSIIIVTGNKRKIGEAKLALQDFGIKLDSMQLEIDEIQSRDPVAIATRKAEDAYRVIKKPLVVTDTFWNIPALHGFPGGYMKDVSDWLSVDDFIKLMQDYDDKTISFTESIAYIDGTQTKVFSEEYFGKIADASRGNGSSIEQLAEFDGYTIGEQNMNGRFSHGPKDYVWYKFAKWFKEQ